MRSRFRFPDAGASDALCLELQLGRQGRAGVRPAVSDQWRGRARPGLSGDHRTAFSIVLVGNQIAGYLRVIVPKAKVGAERIPTSYGCPRLRTRLIARGIGRRPGLAAASASMGFDTAGSGLASSGRTITREIRCPGRRSKGLPDAHARVRGRGWVAGNPT